MRKDTLDSLLVEGVLLKPLFGSRGIYPEGPRNARRSTSRGASFEDLRADPAAREAKISRQVSNKEADLHISTREDGGECCAMDVYMMLGEVCCYS